MEDKNVNSELYEFLKKCETGLYKGKNEIIAYIHIDFDRLKEFTEIIGSYWFDEGGMKVTMFTDSICVEINDIIEGHGQYLSAYKNCFNTYDWEEYKEKIESEVDNGNK
jgi:hypothetical protein